MQLTEQQFNLHGYSITVEYRRGEIHNIFVQKDDGEVLFQGSTQEATDLQTVLSSVLVELVSPNVEVK